MFTTLSQRRPREAEGPSDRSADRLPVIVRSQSLAIVAVAVMATVANTGCQDSTVSGPSQEANGIGGLAGTASATEHAPTGEDFVWPEDPSHPRLTLEIESDTGAGEITIELMPDLAPVTVAQVIELAEQDYYDGTTFHRVIPGFMIQGGDPNSRDRDPSNDGQGNPSLSMPDEFGPAPFVRGVVGMGNKGRRNSTGGQFFIMHADNRNLDGRYTVIGRVRSGMEVVDSIMGVSVDRIGRWGPKDRPIENVVMKSVDIESAGTSEAGRDEARDPKTLENAAESPSNALADR